MDPSEEIKQLYFKATPKTIERDLDRAIDLLKTLPDDEARERLAVYMDGLAQMRSEARGSGGRRGGGKAGGGHAGGSGGGKPAAEGIKKTMKKPGQPGGAAPSAPGTPAPAKRRS